MFKTLQAKGFTFKQTAQDGVQFSPANYRISHFSTPGAGRNYAGGRKPSRPAGPGAVNSRQCVAFNNNVDRDTDVVFRDSHGSGNDSAEWPFPRPPGPRCRSSFWICPNPARMTLRKWMPVKVEGRIGTGRNSPD